MLNLATILKDAEAVAEAFVENFAAMYLNKSSGVSGAPAITAGNIGKMAATLAATSVVVAIQAANAQPVGGALAGGAATQTSGLADAAFAKQQARAAL